MYKIFKIIVISIIAIIVSNSCSEQNKINDRILRNKIIGTWHKTLKRGNFILYVTTKFYRNGIFKTDAIRKSLTNSTKVKLYAKGSWHISKGYLIEHTTSSNFDRIGSYTKDKIIAITKKQFAYKTNKGKIFTYSKK